VARPRRKKKDLSPEERALLALENFEPRITLEVQNPDRDDAMVFSPELAALCLGVHELGSLNAAAKSAGISYNRAWRLVRDAETALGFALLKRNGANGSEVTEPCLKLLDSYLKISRTLQRQAEKLYARAMA
jgi:molybdate transport system regulatory protein